jgi:hypothetical protein
MIGGLGRTGRPVELVRTKGGRSFYLHTGEEVPASEYKQGTKRSAGEESDEDDALRSMARRRKNALPTVKEAQKCSECDKVFKRPCDLTYVRPGRRPVPMLTRSVGNMRKPTLGRGNAAMHPASTTSTDGQRKRSASAT